ncbi:MAG: class I SAM-dependent methyltransferase [Acidovorax sp.]|nr:class I SAM-dependent methyltransferase [Acidovorax sp.]
MPRVAPASRPSRPSSLLQRAHLHPVPSTLLIPLAARALGARYFPWLDCRDAVAAGLLERLGADVDATLDDLATVFHVLWRTRAIQDAGRAFFAAHPQGLGANLGCGLTQHFQWFDTDANQWLDADLPEVMALRRPLLPVWGPRARQAEVDLTQPGWWQRLGLPSRSGAPPVLLVCEGVLMYLQPAQVQAILAEFAQCAPPGSRMVLDVLTRQAVGHAARHPSVGPTGAEFCWGVGRMAELAAVHPRLRLLREQSAAEGYGWAGIALDVLWRPWLGAPVYGVATLAVTD